MLSEPPEILAPDPASQPQKADRTSFKETNQYLPLTFSSKWGGISRPTAPSTHPAMAMQTGLPNGDQPALALGDSHLTTATEPIIVDDIIDNDLTLVNAFPSISTIPSSAAIVGTTTATTAALNKAREALAAADLPRKSYSSTGSPSHSPSPSATLRPTARSSRPPLPRAGDFRRAGPVTPPLHQLYMASRVSLLSSPSTSISTPYESSNAPSSTDSGSTGSDGSPRSSASISPRSSKSLEVVMEDESSLLKMLVTENKTLFDENESFRQELTTMQQQLEVKEQLYCECQKSLEASQTQCTHLTERCTHWEGVARRKTLKYEEKRDKLRKVSAELNQATMISQMFAKSVRENASEMRQLRKSTDALTKRTEELTATNEDLTKSRDEALDALEILSKAEEAAQANATAQAEENARLVATNSKLAETNEGLVEKNTELETKLADLESLVNVLSKDRELLKSSFEQSELKTASLKDKNSSLALELNDLEVRNDELVSRNEGLLETIHLLQEREKELEQTISDARIEFADMEGALADLEAAYAELQEHHARYEDEREYERERGRASGRGRLLDRDERDGEDRASVTSDDMDVAALEEAANAVGHEDFEDDEEYERMRRSSRTLMRPPSSISDIDTSDPAVVASQIKHLESLIEEYKTATAEYRTERSKHEQQVAKFKDVEEDLRSRIDAYIEIDNDLRQRESNYFALCDRREREFLELSDEYEKWRLDCEVREVDVEEERIEVWKHQREIDRREIRLVHRELNCFKREGEVRWRMMCLNGAFEDKERCWRCAKAPKDLFPNPESLFQIFDPHDTSDPPRGRQGKPPKKEDGIERAFLDEGDGRPFEFDNLEAAKEYIADQVMWERERRRDLMVDEEDERAAMNEEAADYDEYVSKRVCDLMAQADERRRKRRREREEAEEGSGRIVSREEAEMLRRAPAYDEEKAKLNVDGLRGLGFETEPTHYPDHYEEDADALERDQNRRQERERPQPQPLSQPLSFPSISVIPDGIPASDFTFTLGASLGRERSNSGKSTKSATTASNPATATAATFTFGAGSTFDSATGTTTSVVASSSRGGAALAASRSAAYVFGTSNSDSDSDSDSDSNSDEEEEEEEDDGSGSDSNSRSDEDSGSAGSTPEEDSDAEAEIEHDEVAPAPTAERQRERGRGREMSSSWEEVTSDQE